MTTYQKVSKEIFQLCRSKTHTRNLTSKENMESLNLNNKLRENQLHFSWAPFKTIRLIIVFNTVNGV